MIRSCVPLVLVIVAWLAVAVVGDEKKSQTINGWGTVVDPDGDCKFEEKDGTVTITVPGTYHDLTYLNPEGKLNGPRIVREVEGDFTIQVKVLRFIRPEGNSTNEHTFVSAGLLIWNDGKEFFRLERASVGTPFAFAAGILDGKNTIGQFHELPDDDTFFRVERKGKQLTLSFHAAEEAEWKELFRDTFELPAKLQAGVHSVNTIDKEFKAGFRELELKQ